MSIPMGQALTQEPQRMQDAFNAGSNSSVSVPRSMVSNWILP